MRNYYVYAHYTADTNELFYIGKGSGNRAYSTNCCEKKGRNNYWNKIVNKHGHRVEILIDNLDEPDAFIQEILAIMEFRPKANFTKGGEGISGLKHTKKTRDLMSKSHRGKKQSKESVEKRVKRGKDHGTFGVPRSKETKRKISKTKKKAGLKTTCRKVYCTETNKVWNSIKECALCIGLKPTTLGAKLRGQSKNNTTIRYYIEG